MLKSKAPSRLSEKRNHATADNNYRRLKEDSSANTQLPKLPGRIISIELINFMCHSRLKLAFNSDEKNCYYIIGANGSGKSALFSGLNIGLGGGGRANDRGNRVQSYIKEGQDSAKIRIVLTNEGPDSHPSYGSEILIERSIASTATTYQLKSRSKNSSVEKLVSKKKKDLDKLLQLFNIELDNPLSWLSQDRARQFLQEMKGEKLYEIFAVSTELQATETIYTQILDLLKEMQAQLQSANSKKALKQKEFDTLVECYNAGRKIQQKKCILLQLKWKQLWSLIKGEDLNIQSENEKIEKVATKMSELEEKIQKYEDESNLAKDAMQSLSLRIEELGRDRNQSKTKVQDETSKLLVCDRHIKEINEKMERKKSEQKSITREYRQTEAQLEKMLGDSNRDINLEDEQLSQRKLDIDNKKSLLQEQRRQLIEAFKQCEEDVGAKISSFQRCQGEVRILSEEVARLEKEQKTFAAAQQDRIALLGQQMPALVGLINRHRSAFQRVPIGPIGTCVKLKDPKWAPAVEFCLKNFSNNFICHSVEDRKLLERLCYENKIPSPSIISYAFSTDKYITIDQEPDQRYLTVLRVTEIQDPTVYNVLIDQAKIENRLLLETDEEARILMRQNPPRNVGLTLTLKCSEVHPQMNSRKIYRFYANNFVARFFVKDLRLDGRNFRDEMNKILGSIDEKKQLISRLGAEKSTAEVNLQNLKSKIRVMEKQIYDCDSSNKSLEEKQQELQKIMSSGDLIENFKKTLEENKRIRNECANHLEDLQQELSEKQQERVAISDKLSELRDDVRNLNRQLEETKETAAEKEQELTNSKERIAHAQRSVEKMEVYTKKCDEKKVQISEARAKREAECREVKDDNMRYQKPANLTDPPDFSLIPTADEIQQEITEHERQIRMAEENRDLKKLVRKDDIVKFKLDNTRFSARIRFFETIYQKLAEIMEGRQTKFHVLKFMLPTILEKAFIEQMSLRGYNGSLNVDHVSCRIDIKVETHKTAASNQLSQSNSVNGAMDSQRSARNFNARGDSPPAKKGKKNVQDLKGLSGGERSYTTACFVMALWKCVESPFRCLDEFDVFMDMLNRKVVMEMLVSFAAENRRNQFFFFTPQGVNELEHRDNIEIFNMPKARDNINN